MSQLPKWTGRQAVFFLALTALTLAAQSTELTGPVEQAVLQAKSEAKTAIQLPGISELPTGVDSLSTIAHDYSAVVAEPVKREIVETNTGIATWYKLLIKDKILEQEHISSDTPSAIPSPLLPLLPNEFLVCLTGGAIKRDNVTVSQRASNNIHFTLKQDYLLFLFFEASGQIGLLAAQENGVYALLSDGQLTPMGNAAHPLVAEVAQRHASQLSSVKAFLLDHQLQTEHEVLHSTDF